MHSTLKNLGCDTFSLCGYITIAGEVVMEGAEFNRERSGVEHDKKHGHAAWSQVSKQWNYLVYCKRKRLLKRADWHTFSYFSEILGKSHYLFVVWFLYDELIYYTDLEFQEIHGTEEVNDVKPKYHKKVFAECAKFPK